MNRKRFRVFLLFLLLLSTAFACWTWMRPYDWRADSAARFKIAAAELRRDNSYHWLELHLKRSGEKPHDLEKPVRLELADGRLLEPADTTFAGNPGEGTTAIWLKFWLGPEDLNGPLKLRINDGSLVVRTGSGVPETGQGGRRAFPSNEW